MARVVIIGGGFGGVVAAESLAQRLGPEHRITLVSRRRDQAQITIISPDSLGGLLGGSAVVPALRTALEKHCIGFITDFSVDFVTAGNVFAKDSRRRRHLAD